MAVANLHIENKYKYELLLRVFILINNLENIDMDTMFVSVSCILSILIK